MTWNPEIKTETLDELTFDARDKVGETALEFWAGIETCNGFAFDYLDENPNAVAKVATVNGQHHCFVYDGDLDVTIDATLGQFDDCPVAGVWDGETHPYLDDRQPEPQEFTDEAAFEDEFGGPYSPFY